MSALCADAAMPPREAARPTGRGGMTMDARIIADLRESYGIAVCRMTPVTGGLLNLKWKVSTQQGEVLVKQYSMQRFRRAQIERIESALGRQVLLHRDGVPCPFLWQREGRVIRWLEGEIAYLVMEFRAGRTECADTITAPQMRSLGGACARMQGAFSRLHAPASADLPLYGGYALGALWEHFRSRLANCPPDAPDEYHSALLALEPILKRLRPDFFTRFPIGFAHEDFHAGNILFGDGCVSAIVDFDRNCWSYVWHDIGRAILSFALHEGALSAERVGAFLEGYCAHAPLTLRDIADALRLTWCVEVPWWIQPEFFGECGEVPRRFKDEMLWLTRRWLELEEMG